MSSEPKFAVGQKVKVVKPVFDFYWNKHLDILDGMTAHIKIIIGNGALYYLNSKYDNTDLDISFKPEWLQAIEDITIPNNLSSCNTTTVALGNSAVTGRSGGGGSCIISFTPSEAYSFPKLKEPDNPSRNSPLRCEKEQDLGCMHGIEVEEELVKELINLKDEKVKTPHMPITPEYSLSDSVQKASKLSRKRAGVVRRAGKTGEMLDNYVKAKSNKNKPEPKSEIQWLRVIGALTFLSSVVGTLIFYFVR